MRFAVLGPTEVWDADRPVELGPARRRLVLAALLVDFGRVVPTHVLLDRVWDGRPPDSATASLHSYISRLRSTLSSAVASSPATLATSPRGYALDIAGEDLDQWRFADLLDRAQGRAADGDPVAARDLLDTALGLWRGPAYTDFDSAFTRAEAERLHDRRLAAHELAAELDLALGRHVSLAGSLPSLVAEEPLRESLRGSLMLALYRSGRQAEALAVYAEGRQLLVEQLGADPDLGLQRLHERILRQDPALAPDVELRETVTTVPPPAPTDRFVGRTAETQVLTEALDRARAGSSQFVAVVGEAGIGKSRLVEETALSARSAGDLIAWGRCWQHDGAPAWWPWTQVVRDLAAGVPADVLAEALSGRGAVVASLVPELADATRAVAVPASPDAAEVAVFDGIASFLGAIARRRPLAVVIDDAQWADPASRRMLEHAAIHLREQRITLLVTVRSPTDDDSRRDLDILAALARQAQVRRVDLPPLTPVDVADLVADRAASELDERTALALHARTNGNPFYIGEIVRLVIATGAERAMSEGVPDSVRGVIRRRVQQLPEIDQTILRTAAVIGRTFDIELIATVAGASEDEVDAAIDDATAAGLLRSEPGSADQHRFTHALLQETLLDETGPTRRRRMHRTIAEALHRHRAEAGPHAAAAERIAHHFAEAGSEADLLRAAEYYLVATDDANARRSYAEVEPLLRAALQLTGRLGGSAGVALDTTVRYRLSSFYLLFDGAYSDEARWQLMRGVSSSEDEATARDLLTALHIEWGAAHGQNRIAEGERSTARMAALADERDDDLLRIAALMTAGYNLLQRGRFADSAEAFARMEPLLPRVTIPGLVFTPHPVPGAPLWRSVALTLMGEVDRGDKLFDHARELCRHLGDPVSLTYLDGVALLRAVWLDDPGLARSAAAVSAASVEASNMGMMRIYMSMPTAWALSHHDLAAGLAAADAAAGTIDEPDGLVWRPFLRGLHADILTRAGHPERAIARIEHALAESAASGAVFYDAELHRIRAASLAATGADPAVIMQALDTARAIAAEQGAGLFSRRLDQLTV